MAREHVLFLEKMAPLFWHLNTVVFDYGPFTALFICFCMAVAYVGSLYICTKSTLGRDHPETIMERFVRVAIICTLVIPFLWLCSRNSHDVRARIMFTWIGIRFKGFLYALVLPLILTMLLFLGPLTLHYMDGIFRIYQDPHYWLSNLKNVMWLRNHIVAPLTEEFMFRACMLPLLVPSVGAEWSILVCPLFFGVAHFHHLREKLKEGQNLKFALQTSAFQFFYTTLFGAYCAFLFLRTGHLIAPVMAHAFCNHMGFPDFQQVFAYRYPKRIYVMGAFVAGLLLWMWLLMKMTAPWIYSNDLYVV